MSPEEAAQPAGAVRPAELSAQQRDAMRERIVRRVREPAPAETYTIRSGEGEWIRTSPLSEIKLVRRDWAANNQSMLVRLAAGTEIATYTHTQE